MTYTVTPAPDTSPPDKFGGDPVAFDAAMQAHLTWQAAVVDEMNAQNVENNTINANVNSQTAAAAASVVAAAAQATAAATSASAAAASINFKGAWSSLTGALNVPSTVAHLGRVWMLLNNLANVTTSVPGTDTANWLAVSTPARPDVQPTLSVDWTQKPTAAALTAAGWTIARTGEITSFGLPTKAAENLFTRSQDFSVSPWQLALATRSAVTDESGLVGSTVVATAVAGYHSISVGVTNTNIGSANYRVRFLCKAAGYTKCIIGEGAAGRAGAAFDLATGAVIGTGYGAGYVSHSIAAHELGGGLYWCELVMTSPAAGTGWNISLVGYPDSGATINGIGAQYTGDGVSGIEVYAAQLQQGFDGDYIPTTTDPITLYEPQLVTTAANELAYQHDANGQCVGLVQYPSDTNLILQSQDLSNASWLKASVAVTASKRKWAGSVPFWRVRKTGTGTGYCVQAISFSALSVITPYTATVALLADQWSGCTTATIGVRNETAGAWPASSGVVISGPGSVSGTDVISVTGLSTTVPTLVRVTAQVPIGCASVGVYVYPQNNSTGTLGAAILATRVHLSASPRLMPYIPTTTAAVTRGAQSITLGGSAFTAVNNPAQGTLLAKASVEDLVWDISRTSHLMSTGGNVNWGISLLALDGSGAARAQILTNGVSQANTAVGSAIGITPVTHAVSYANNSFQLGSGSALSATDTSVIVPPLNRMEMGVWTGLIQRTELYPRAMTSAELAAITTPGVL